jgi:uroporphyrinogen III methyltransferase/synthase
VIECPTIKIVPPDDFTQLDMAINGIAAFDWLILTSVNAVKFFFERLEFLGKDARALASCKIAVVGPQTAVALQNHGLHPDLIPLDYKAEGVIAEFEKIDISGKRVLFPKADLARDIIPQELERLGATCANPVAYRNIQPDGMPAEAAQALEEGELDCITFTSSSTVVNLAKIVGERTLPDLLKGVAVASIGPITSQTCRELGLRVDIEPEKFTLAALSEKIHEYFSAATPKDV